MKTFLRIYFLIFINFKFKLCFLISAEFIIDLAKKNNSFESFKSALLSNGAEFADSFIENLLRIIKHMEAGKKQGPKKSKDQLAMKFPGLAMPNDQKLSKKLDQKQDGIDDAMAALEALAPSRQHGGDEEKVEIRESKSEKRKKSRSPEKTSRKRSRSRDKDRSKRYDSLIVIRCIVASR